MEIELVPGEMLNLAGGWFWEFEMRQLPEYEHMLFLFCRCFLVIVAFLFCHSLKFIPFQLYALFPFCPWLQNNHS